MSTQHQQIVEAFESYVAESENFEAKGVKAYIEENPLDKLLLVTSEMHMRRALAMFHKQGIFPDTYSVNRQTSSFNWQMYIPSVGGLAGILNCFYEIVGYFGYFIRGDI